MKITIVDERQGNIIRPEDYDKLGFDNTDVVITITNERITVSEKGKIPDIDVSFIQAVHRDVISGEKSAEARQKQIDSMGTGHEPGQREAAMEKAKAVWDV